MIEADAILARPRSEQRKPDERREARYSGEKPGDVIAHVTGVKAVEPAQDRQGRPGRRPQGTWEPGGVHAAKREANGEDGR
jgi:hypothetical protein